MEYHTFPIPIDAQLIDLSVRSDLGNGGGEKGEKRACRGGVSAFIRSNFDVLIGHLNGGHSHKTSYYIPNEEL